MKRDVVETVIAGLVVGSLVLLLGALASYATGDGVDPRTHMDATLVLLFLALAGMASAGVVAFDNRASRTPPGRDDWADT